MCVSKKIDLMQLARQESKWGALITTRMWWQHQDLWSYYIWTSSDQLLTLASREDKSETQGTLKRFLRQAQNEFELKVKKIRSDNGSEFKNLQVEEYLEKEGIKHEFSAPYTPQQNGVVERKNRTLIDMVRRCLENSRRPSGFGRKLWTQLAMP
jgi:transposase InsO family protein